MAKMPYELFDGRAALPLAEHLDAEYSTALMRCFITKRSSKGRLVSAWNHIEYGLNTSVDMPPESRKHYLANAQDLLTIIHHRPGASPETHLEAIVLSTYIPLFLKRTMCSEVTKDDCTIVYVSLGRALEYLKPFEDNEIPPTTTLETLILALSARMQQPGMLLFPTSPREEASGSQSVNHDSYFVSSGAKLPIQQKLIHTGKEYAAPITMLTLMPLVDKAYKKHWPDDDMTLAEKLNAIIAAVIAEAHTEQLTMCEKGCLDYLSSAVAAHYREALTRAEQTQAA